jgi:hypothetical protein
VGAGIGCPEASSIESLRTGGVGAGIGCPEASSIESLRTGGVGAGIGCPVEKKVLTLVAALTEPMTGGTINTVNPKTAKA